MQSTFFNEYRQCIEMTVYHVFKSKRPWMLTCDNMLLHDNARPHTVNLFVHKLNVFPYNLLPQPANNLEIFSLDFHIFGPLKKHLKGCRI
ncbi:hypothetical protein C0J52_19400 [Blattella germanica]|nr:hypothetical protein C0J52_19400 [Blattella germanica]